MQAGTGTGKSLAYLVPAIRHAIAKGARGRLHGDDRAAAPARRPRPARLAKALKPPLAASRRSRSSRAAATTCACTKRASGAPDETGGPALRPVRRSPRWAGRSSGMQEWASETETGDRDELVPGVTDQAWRQVSVTRQGVPGRLALPDRHGVLRRAGPRPGRAGRRRGHQPRAAGDRRDGGLPGPARARRGGGRRGPRAGRPGHLGGQRRADRRRWSRRRAAAGQARSTQDVADRLVEAGEGLALVLATLPAGRLDDAAPAAGARSPRSATRRAACITALGPRTRGGGPGGRGRARWRWPRWTRSHDTAAGCSRRSTSRGRRTGATSSGWRRWPRPAAAGAAGGAAGGRRAAARAAVRPHHGGPDVGDAGPGRHLRRAGPPVGPAAGAATSRSRRPTEKEAPSASPRPRSGRGLDVGSPFDHPRSGILYVAKHLPPPGRDGLPAAYLDEIAELIEAAGGRTLGLFSSMRAAKQATEALRDRLSVPLLCQGDDATMLLVKQFAEDERTCLFGTLSLWQGVDVPGPSLPLVIIDRIPFPRPDDPLSSARQRAVTPAAATGSYGRGHPRRAAAGPGRRPAAARRWTTAAWSRCSTRGWRPPATADSSAPPCRRSGRRTTGEGPRGPRSPARDAAAVAAASRLGQLRLQRRREAVRKRRRAARRAPRPGRPGRRGLGADVTVRAGDLAVGALGQPPTIRPSPGGGPPCRCGRMVRVVRRPPGTKSRCFRPWSRVEAGQQHRRRGTAGRRDRRRRAARAGALVERDLDGADVGQRAFVTADGPTPPPGQVGRVSGPNVAQPPPRQLRARHAAARAPPKPSGHDADRRPPPVLPVDPRAGRAGPARRDLRSRA